MKYLRLAILLLLIPLCCVAFAALSKTSNIGESEVDAWQKVLAGTLVVGNVGDISGSYDVFVVLEIAYAHDNSQEGVRVKVETSYGDDNWVLLKSFTTPVEISPESTTLDGAVAAADTVISLINSTGFNLIGLKWFIENSAENNKSESVRTKSVSVNDVTLCHDVMQPHDSGQPVWEIVHEYIIPIPASFAAFRVTIHDIDTDADIFFTTRFSEVKDL